MHYVDVAFKCLDIMGGSLNTSWNPFRVCYTFHRCATDY